MVHENLKDLKLEVPPDDTMLTMQDIVTTRVQWRQTSIDVDPLAAALASTTPSQPNTSSASIFPETRLSPSPNQEQLRLSPIGEQLRWSPIREQPRRSPI
jgi:type III secretory pathway lipoprotein EscJ